MTTKAQIERLRNKLIAVAKSKDPRIAYSQVDHIVALNMGIPYHRTQFGRILAELGGNEVKARRPFLPAVVVRKWTRRPGDGFSKEIRKMLPQYRHITSNAKLHDAVLADVIKYWAAR